MKLNLKDILFIVVITAMAFFLFDGCEAKRVLEKQSVSIANYEDTVAYYKSESGKQVVINKALEINSIKQIKGLEEALADLKVKKAKVAIKYETSVEIKEVEVPIEIPCEDFSLPFELDSTYYKIKGLLTNETLKFNTISIPNEQLIVVANKRKKWYKKSEYSVVVTNSNPYVTSVGLQAYTIEPEKELYKKRWFWAVLGFAGGIYVTNKLEK